MQLLISGLALLLVSWSMLASGRALVCHSPGVLSGPGCPGAGALRELPLAEAASGILAAANGPGARPVHRPSQA